MEEEDNMVQDPNEIIKQQQLQIEELKMALERSNQQLLSQNNVLKYEVSDPSQDIQKKHDNSGEPVKLSVKKVEQEANQASQILNYAQPSSMDDVFDILMNNGGKHRVPRYLLLILITNLFQISQTGWEVTKVPEYKGEKKH